MEDHQALKSPVYLTCSKGHRRNINIASECPICERDGDNARKLEKDRDYRRSFGKSK